MGYDALEGNYEGLIMSFGDNLKRLRRDKGWTQGDLAEAAGIKTTHIPNLENEKGDPKLSTVYKLLGALECSPDQLLTDMNKAGNEVRMMAALERLSELPVVEQNVVIDLIDKYCIANAFTKQIDGDSSKFLGKHWLIWKDRPQPMADQVALEAHYADAKKV